MSDALLKVENLTRYFDVSKPWLNRMLEREDKQFLTAVADLNFEIKRGETFALVGESGSGKSTIAKMVVGLLGASDGTIEFDGHKMTGTAGAEMRDLRRRFQMIFQDPFASLNPRWRVGDIIAEPIHTFGLLKGAEVSNRVGELLDTVGLSAKDAEKFPHEFSGGQRQRIAIARALSSKPEFIVCDEPTSALDVSVQAQILNLMKDLQDEMGLTYLFISHDLSVFSIWGVWSRWRTASGCSPSRSIPIRGCYWTLCRIWPCQGGGASRSRARSPIRSARRPAAPSTRAVRW